MRHHSKAIRHVRRLGASLGLVLGALPARGQTSTTSEPAISATRVTLAPVIDGRRDDAAWATGPVSSDFRVFAPREGPASTVRTEVRVRYDECALYFLVRAFPQVERTVVASEVAPEIFTKPSHPLASDRSTFVPRDSLADAAGDFPALVRRFWRTMDCPVRSSSRPRAWSA